VRLIRCDIIREHLTPTLTQNISQLNRITDGEKPAPIYQRPSTVRLIVYSHASVCL